MSGSVQGISGVSRSAGAALMGAVLVMIIGSQITPGISLIDPVKQSDLPLALDALGQNANLSHITTLLAMLAMLLYTRGFLSILQTVRSEPGLSGSVLRIGLGASIFGWAIFTIAMGMRHMAIHLVQRSAEEVELTASLSQLEAAGAVFVAMTAVLIAFFAVFPIGTLLTGIGLAARFRTVGLGMIAAWGMVILGTAAFLNFHAAMHVTSFDPETMLQVNNVMLGVGSGMLFLLGLGLFRNREPTAG